MFYILFYTQHNKDWVYRIVQIYPVYLTIIFEISEYKSS